jgi:hypothetical protein
MQLIIVCLCVRVHCVVPPPPAWLPSVVRFLLRVRAWEYRYVGCDWRV